MPCKKTVHDIFTLYKSYKQAKIQTEDIIQISQIELKHFYQTVNMLHSSQRYVKKADAKFSVEKVADRVNAQPDLAESTFVKRAFILDMIWQTIDISSRP